MQNHMNKIISFCLWGKNPKYLDGAFANILLQKQVYPDWTCRFYIDDSIPQEFVIQAMNNGCEVELMEPRSDGFYGTFWRFEVFKDTTIDYAIVRDVDSRLNPREADAVEEWIESGEWFHIMRDNPQHNAKICGGMFGVSNEFIKKIAPEYDNLLKGYLGRLDFYHSFQHFRGRYFNVDQPFLWDCIWPRIVNHHIAHVAPNLPQLIFTHREKIFRVINPDNSFVGQPYETA